MSVCVSGCGIPPKFGGWCLCKYQCYAIVIVSIPYIGQSEAVRTETPTFLYHKLPKPLPSTKGDRSLSSTHGATIVHIESDGTYMLIPSEKFCQDCSSIPNKGIEMY